MLMSQGRMVVIVANLKARNMRGIKSAGMVLAASNEEHTVVELLGPPLSARPGDRVYFAAEAGGLSPPPPPAAPNAVEKKKFWEAAQPHLRTDGNRDLIWRGRGLWAGGEDGGPVKSPSLVEALVA